MKQVRLFILLVVFTGALGLQVSAIGGEQTKGSPYLTGELLVATPKLSDPNFSKTVVLMVEHDADGAFGLIVNRLIGTGPLKDLVMGLGFESATAEGDISLRFGGPVERGQAFVVHGSDYEVADTVKVGSGLSVTNQSRIITDMATGNGPAQRMIVLGYAGWGAGQLDREIARGDWFSMAADKALVFSPDIDTIWERARARAGLAL